MNAAATVIEVTGSACRSCGAAIRWTRSTTGSLMPLDAEPVDGGNVLLTGRRVESKQGGLIDECRVEAGPPMFDDGTPRYLAHFATCPHAADWRKS